MDLNAIRNLISPSSLDWTFTDRGGGGGAGEKMHTSYIITRAATGGGGALGARAPSYISRTCRLIEVHTISTLLPNMNIGTCAPLSKLPSCAPDYNHLLRCNHNRIFYVLGIEIYEKLLGLSQSVKFAFLLFFST